MRVLVTGAKGFIGRAAVDALRDRGHDVIELAHRDPHTDHALDFARASIAEWRALLAGVDAVVNCAGIFADEGASTLQAINVDGAARLFQACAEAGVRRVIQLSAIGAEEGLSPFARSKRAAEYALKALDLDWVILRPSIVWGADANGGSALLRGLAGLPILPCNKEIGDLQVVQLDDVARTIVLLAEPGAPSRVELDLVGPERVSFYETVQQIRTWLGWRRAPHIPLPSWIMVIGLWLGDLAGALGWRTPIRSGAARELKRGGVGDGSSWRATTGIEPLALSEALRRRRATAQDRTFAALYFMQPLIIVITGLFLIGTGVTSVWWGYDIGVSLLQLGGLGALSGPSVIAGGVADAIAGLMILYRPTARWGLYLGIALSLFYGVAGTLLLPGLWRDPIGPMLKIPPIVVLSLVALAMVRKR